MTKEEVRESLIRLSRDLGVNRIKQADVNKIPNLKYSIRERYHYLANALKDSGLIATSLAEKNGNS